MNNNYKPWWSNKVIKYLEPILQKNMLIFEWGTGYSTIWLAQRVNLVYTMEHDTFWHDKIENLCNDLGLFNIRFLIKDIKSNLYVNSISRLGKFDLIIVDGRERVKCFNAGIKCVTKQGLIMVDDSDRDRYSSIYDIKDIVIVEKIKGYIENNNLQEATFFKLKI